MTGFTTVYPCGRGNLPGTQGQGSGGSEPPITPVILIPDPPNDPDPPFDPPWIPPTVVSTPTPRPPVPGPVSPDPILSADPDPGTVTASYHKCVAVSVNVCPGEEYINPVSYTHLTLPTKRIV